MSILELGLCEKHKNNRLFEIKVPFLVLERDPKNLVVMRNDFVGNFIVS